MIWTVQNHFGPIEGQGITHLDEIRNRFCQKRPKKRMLDH